jgi:hypothetical protein
MSNSIWDDIPSVWLTSFWGWSPETWGKVGFTAPGRRDTVVRETSDPFIMVVYVTKQAPNDDPDIRGKVAGFYIVSHIQGHRDEFTAPKHHQLTPHKWIYSLKALRAFSFLPEYRLDIDEFDPTIVHRAQSVARDSEELDKARIDKLRSLPFVEVPVFGGAASVDGDIIVPHDGRTKVKAGPVNRSGYFVPGEPLDTPKELYALRLHGNMSHYLGEDAEGREIFKIGLSMSPQTRHSAFQRAMPGGAFVWELCRTTQRDGHARYPSFEVAEAGEDKMKDILGEQGKHLGGEFYAATKNVFDAAWKAGRQAALSSSKK